MSTEILLSESGDRTQEVPTREITFGWELTLDLYNCDQEAITTEETIRQFGLKLCPVIDMVPYGEPQTPYFGENNRAYQRV